MWDYATGRRLITLPFTLGLFGPGDRIVGWETKGGKIRLWGMSDGRELRVFRDRNGWSNDPLIWPMADAAGRILAATNNHRINFYDLESGKELSSARLSHTHVIAPFVEPSGLNVLGNGDELGGWVTGGPSGVHDWPLWNDPARPDVLRIGPPRPFAPKELVRNSAATGAGFSQGGRFVAVPQGDETQFLDRSRPGWRLVFGPQFDVRQAAVSPDGRLVATCSWFTDNRSKGVRVWDVATGRQVGEMLEGLSRAWFTPCGHWLITSSNHVVQMWDVKTWQEVRRYDASLVAFSPDKRLMAIDDLRDGVRLVEVATDREVARLAGPDPGPYPPWCFTQDGTRLLTAGPASVCVWDLRLIRRQLKDLGLDWEWPEYPPPVTGGTREPVRAVEIDLGELGRPSPEKRARDDIDRYRKVIAANSDNPSACNNLAWAYLTAPGPLRDVKSAVPLAEKAVRIKPQNAVYINTLGLAYYRDGRFREAANVLRQNLKAQETRYLAVDLYFLAMSHLRLGETTRAGEYYDMATRLARMQRVLAQDAAAHRAGTQRTLTADELQELNEFGQEADQLFLVETAPPPRGKP